MEVDSYHPYRTSGFKICMLLENQDKLVESTSEEIESIGDRILFVGYNGAMCFISSLYQGIEGIAFIFLMISAFITGQVITTLVSISWKGYNTFQKTSATHLLKWRQFGFHQIGRDIIYLLLRHRYGNIWTCFVSTL
jgi:Protein of unknown function (DUF295)